MQVSQCLDVDVLDVDVDVDVNEEKKIHRCCIAVLRKWLLFVRPAISSTTS